MVGVTMTALLAGSIGLLAAERSAVGELRPRERGALVGGTVVVSVLAVWSLVGNQALFASREALGRKEWNEARKEGRRAEALLFWSAEPELALGDAAAGLGDRDGALRAYRAAVKTDPRSWVAWLDVAQVARGAERAAAYRRVHALNPVDKELPGE
jgi:tetratricopeptide (TPR) repeat protein